MKNRFFILISAATVFLYSCHSAKNIQKPVVAKDTAVAIAVTAPPDHAKEDSSVFIKEMYKGVLDNHINFTTFSGKADLDYEDAEGKKINANAHIRMYSDSVIWLLLTGPLGIEGVRAYITKDSVKMLYKQEKTYTARSISYLQEVAALPLDLSTLQDLLLGNPIFLDSTITSYSKSGNTVSLQSFGSFFKNLFTIDQTNKLVQSSRLDDLDTVRNRTCYLTYTDYEANKGMSFSTKRTINVADKKKLSIKMNFKQYEFNEKLSFPFSVPKNYAQN